MSVRDQGGKSVFDRLIAKMPDAVLVRLMDECFLDDNSRWTWKIKYMERSHEVHDTVFS
jgi:hypothetical protein